MQHPATRAPVLPRRRGPRLGDLVGEPLQRLHHLRQVARLGGPVVHRQVDVDRVLAVPGRIGAVVPDPLEVGGLGAGPRARDEQVAAKLVVERRQTRVRVVREARDAFVRGQRLGLRGRAQAERDPVEPRTVLRHVSGPQGVPVAVVDSGKHRPHPGGRIRRNVLVVDEVRRGREQEHDFVGIPDVQGAVVDRNRSTGQPGPDAPLIAQAAFDTQVVGALARDAKLVRRQAVHQKVVGAVVRVRRIPHAVQVRGEGHGTGTVGGDAHRHDLIDRAGEHLATVGGAVDDIAHRRHAGCEIEFPGVLRRRFVSRKVEPKVGERLVLHHLVRHAHHGAPEEIVGAHEVSREEMATDLRQRLVRSFDDGVVGTARPQRLLVQLDALTLGAAKHHRAQAPVAHRKRLIPCQSGLVVPEQQRVITLLRMPGKAHEHENGEETLDLSHLHLSSLPPPRCSLGTLGGIFAGTADRIPSP